MPRGQYINLQPPKINNKKFIRYLVLDLRQTKLSPDDRRTGDSLLRWTAFGLDARELGDLDSEWCDTIGREFYSSQSVS